MNDDSNEKICRWFTIAILLVVIIGGVYWVWPKFRRGQGLRKQEAELDAKIAETERRIAETEENERRFAKDPEFVEFVARENNLVKPGEFVFKFEEKSGGGKEKEK